MGVQRYVSGTVGDHLICIVGLISTTLDAMELQSRSTIEELYASEGCGTAHCDSPSPPACSPHPST